MFDIPTLFNINSTHSFNNSTSDNLSVNLSGNLFDMFMRQIHASCKTSEGIWFQIKWASLRGLSGQTVGLDRPFWIGGKRNIICQSQEASHINTVPENAGPLSFSAETSSVFWPFHEFMVLRSYGPLRKPHLNELEVFVTRPWYLESRKSSKILSQEEYP